MFNSILNSASSSLSLYNASICLLTSVLCGLVIGVIYQTVSKASKPFTISLVLLPALVQVVIMMVNGNLGAGVAVAGAFSLIRFRSMPGKASDIITIFFAMSIGLATGMGYVAFAGVVTILICLLYLILFKTSFGEVNQATRYVKVTIPEDLDYTNIFDDIFSKYTKNAEMESVRTTNLGSMYQLNYEVVLKDVNKEKEMLDAIRCKNGNLTVISTRRAPSVGEL